jgi:hypothetical protein
MRAELLRAAELARRDEPFVLALVVRRLPASLVREAQHATLGEGDEEAIRSALALNPAYLGVVASARRFALMRETLLARGMAAADVDAGKIYGGGRCGPRTLTPGPSPSPSHRPGEESRDIGVNLIVGEGLAPSRVGGGFGARHLSVARSSCPGGATAHSPGFQPWVGEGMRRRIPGLKPWAECPCPSGAASHFLSNPAASFPPLPVVGRGWERGPGGEGQ